MNIIIICSDTFRYDHLGFLKRQPVQTPNLDKLAAESAVFTDFRLCSFPTVVNRFDVFTGQYTFPHVGWGKLPRTHPVLAEVFQRHGFTTALISDNPHLVREGFGFERGFQYIKAIPGQAHDKFQGPRAPMTPAACPLEKVGIRPANYSRYRRNAYWYQQQGTNTTEIVFQNAMRWIQEPRQKFFLWIDAFDPHEPWDAPDRFLKQYSWNQQGDRILWPKQGYDRVYSTADLENARSLYRAEVSQIDFWVGECISALGQSDLLEDTAIIFCSDHGFYLGEHKLIGKLLAQAIKKPNPLYEELTHLPLLIRHPHGTGAGKMLSGLCQPPDLFPTALELAGIPRVPWAQGHSLVARLSGVPSPQNFTVGGSHPHERGRACLAVHSQEWFLLYSPTQGLAGSELFHCPTDPDNLNNIISENPEPAQVLFSQMEQWLLKLGVSNARRDQLLFNAPYGGWDRFHIRLQNARHRIGYWQRYRHYARGS